MIDKLLNLFVLVHSRNNLLVGRKHKLFFYFDLFLFGRLFSLFSLIFEQVGITRNRLGGNCFAVLYEYALVNPVVERFLDVCLGRAYALCQLGYRKSTAPVIEYPKQ